VQWLLVNVSAEFAVQLVGVRNAFQFLRQFDQPNGLTWAGDRTAGTHAGLTGLDGAGGADDFSILAGYDCHLHVALLTVVDGQVAEKNNFQVEWNGNTALVPDLELVKDLRRARIARATATFSEVVDHENIFGGIVSAL
jgi:hypothetical protein